jgi:hypothetical protein
MALRKPRTVAETIIQSRKHLRSLRKLIYPVLSRQGKYEVSEGEQLTGFWLLDSLREDMNTIEKQLGLPPSEE